MTPDRPATHRKSARHRVAAVLAGGILAGALAALVAAPATADDGPAMLLSTDGVHFTSGQEPTVFPHLAGLVPGESRPGTVWVRNAGTQPAAFDLAVRSGAGSAVLTGSLELLAGSPGRATVTVPLSDPGQCTSVLQGWALAPGETMRLNLVLGMNVAASNATRHEQSGVELVFLMQESGAGTAIPACAAPGGTSGVDHQAGQAPAQGMHSNVVGNDQRPAQLLTAVGALFFGVALVRRRRNP